MAGTTLTWFVLKDGTLDEIEVRDPTLNGAMQIGRQIGASHFIRKNPIHGTKKFLWDAFAVNAPLGAPIKPVRTFNTETIDAAHMWALARGAG